MMNKKSVILTGVVISLLTGCSASSVLSTATAQNSPVKQVEVKQEQKTLQQMVKPQRNTIQMKKVIKYLKTRVGKTAYVFSGASPRGWDCSGLVRWTYERFGIELPHSANKQGHLGKRVSKPKLGDIVVFAYNGYTSFYHSAIYIGNGQIINAHRGVQSTIIQPLTDYASGQIRFIRVIATQ
jgi:cell wall-associated NlpC family hydrolase